MKVKLAVWAEVDEDEYDAVTDAQSELSLIMAHLIDYDTKMDISRREWEEDGLEWDEEE